ncbi:hypothetical protein N9X54_10345 [Planktomarina temperata]|nr:hypothetical protein [Planktomarina temperata]
MKAKLFKEKLNKKTPLLMSPFGFALAACGGGGGGTDSSTTTTGGSTSGGSPTQYKANGYAVSGYEIETNNTMATANIAQSSTIRGSTSRTDADYFYFSAAANSVVNLNFENTARYYSNEVTILDSYGNTMASRIISEGNLAAKVVYSGGVWVKVEHYNSSDDYIVIQSTTYGDYEREPNNTPTNADELTSGVTYTGQSNSSGDKDYFHFTATSSQHSISFDQSAEYTSNSVTILNSNLEVVSEKTLGQDETISFGTISGAKYYVLVEEYNSQDDYTIKLNSNYNTGSDTISLSQLNFVEQSTPETRNDYDWAILDRANDTFVLHIEESDDFGFFDKAVEDITQDSSVTAFAILFGNDNSEDVEGGFGSESSHYNWILADSVTVVGDAGFNQYIKVTDHTLDQVVINNNYDYISFAINTGSFWIAEDFLIADMTVA